MKRIYVSIPITGYEIEEVQERALEVKRALSRTSVEVVTPFDVVSAEDTAGMADGEAYAYCMGRDIESILLSDAVYFCRGWEASKGCRTEMEVATIYNKEIIKEFQSKV